MTKVIAHKLNETFLRVQVDRGVAQELSEFFAFRPEGYQFMPAYRNKVWDGYVRLFNRDRNTLYVGLTAYLKKFAEERGYDLELNGFSPADKMTPADVLDFSKTLNLSSGGNPIEPRDYQLDAVAVGIRDRRRLLISPTASGKSLILYLTIRYLLHTGLANKICLVVPSVSLVKQMIGDFKDYAQHDDWDADENCHGIHAGVEKSAKKPITVTTWQSVFKLPAKWFKQFDAAFMDEAHTVKAKSLTGIVESMTDCSYRIGTTGTLDDSQINRLVLIGLMGDVYQVTTTKKLIDDGTLAQFKVNAIQLDYPDEDRKGRFKVVEDDKGRKSRVPDYKTEVDYISNHVGRLKITDNLAKVNGDKNGLFLFNYIKHGKAIFESTRAALEGTGRQVFYVDGNTAVETREQIRKQVEKLKGAVIVASYGVYSTGINIKNLHYAVFASPTKAKIRNLQSIGRILRKPADGASATLFDLIDDLTWKGSEGYAVKHARERFKTYMNERFKVKTHKLRITE